MTPSPVSPSLVLGRYELFDEIGAGGMATVHLARAHGAGGFSRLVAVKRLNEQYARDPDFVAMFVDEARVASRIRHPNVVQIYDVASLEGELFLVLEYVSGIALSRLIAPQAGVRRPIPPAIAASLFVGVLEGLHAAHEARDEKGTPLQIVHRDVSPQNILVGEDGMAHLLDFGIAKAVGRSQVTRDGALKGKVPYMAPEQFRGEAVTRAVDVYAAAVTLWEALAGRRLFEAEEQPELLVRVLSAPVPAPSTIAPDVPAALDAVVMRGLDRERTRRFPTAAAMARAIEAAITPASSHAVAEWVAGLAHDELSQRSALAARIEVTSASIAPVIEEPVIAKTSSSAPPPPARRGTMILAALVIACVTALAMFALRREERSAEPSPTEPVATPTPNISVRSAAPAARSTDMSTGPEGTLVNSTSTSTATPTLVRRPAKKAPSTKPANDCDPPYTMEGDHKVWKRHCLR